MQLTLEGKTKVQVAIERLREYEPPEGYYLAFSGGKDSMCIYHLAKMAGVIFDAHYSVTGIDPPELVQFIKKQYPDVQRHLPGMSMWRWIEKKGLPTRRRRWCCEKLKEVGGIGRVTVVGIRAEESNNRRHRQLYQVGSKKTILCPILDWNLADVWEFIDHYKLPYCSLYDTSFDRLGCIGCPLSHNQIFGFKLYPKIRDAWYRAAVRHYEAKRVGGTWPNADAMWEWWLSQGPVPKQNQGAMELTV